MASVDPAFDVGHDEGVLQGPYLKGRGGAGVSWDETLGCRMVSVQ